MDEAKISKVNYHQVLRTLTIESLQSQFPDAIITIENGNFAVRGSVKDVKTIQALIEEFYSLDDTNYKK